MTNEKIDVESLRRSGYKVRVHHHRKLTRVAKLDGKALVAAARGGRTVIEITTPDGETLIGTARCSRKENFNKKLGVRIALGRALKGVVNEGSRVVEQQTS